MLLMFTMIQDSFKSTEICQQIPTLKYIQPFVKH